MCRAQNIRCVRGLLLTVLLCTSGAAAAAPAAGEIVTRAYENYSGDDFVSRLSFTLEYDDNKTDRLSMLMAYKRYDGENGLDSKVIMFNEFPPDKKDIAFLAWIYRPGAGREDEMWLYLPELRQIRKLGHKHDAHSHEDQSSDAFSVSELNREELTPRRPGLDRHRLLGEGTVDGRPVYKIESTPREPDSSTYSELVQWISKDIFLPLRIDYYDDVGTLLKTQTIDWTRQGDAWVWEKVTAVNHVNDNRTILDQSRIQINTGLPDRLFSKRVMKRGAQSFLARVRRATN